MQEHELPSLKDELERKTIETLQWIIQMHESGQATGAQANFAFQTAFGIVAGLVSRDTMNLFDDLKLATSEKESVRRFFYRDSQYGGTDIVVLSWTVGTSEVHAWEKPALGDSPRHKVYTKKSPAEAQESLSSMCELLSLKGAIEL